MNIGIFTKDKNKFYHLLREFEEIKDSINGIFLLSTSELENKEMTFCDKSIRITNINNFNDFSNINCCIFDVSSELTEKYIYDFIENNCIVLNSNNLFIDDKEIPTIVYDVNKKDIKKYENKNIINIPSPSTIQLAKVLNILNKKNNKIKKCIVSTYQSASTVNKEAMDELFNHTKKIYENSFLSSVIFKKQIPFNVIPQSGDKVIDNYYEEEYKIIKEIKNILKVKVTATCVMVPTFTCTCQSLNIQFENEINMKEINKILNNNDEIKILDNPEEYKYATPKETSLESDIFLSRIRKDNTDDLSINIWSVADNLVLFSKNIVNIIKFLLAK